MKPLVQLVQRSGLGFAPGSCLAKTGIESGEISCETLALRRGKVRGSAGGQPFQLADDLEQLLHLLLGERRDRHSRLLSRRGHDIALPLEALESGAHRRPAYAEA